MRIGILGAGGMGNVHARHYRRIDGVELFFFEPEPDRAAKYAETHGAHLCSSVDDLISKVEAVDICLPTDMHFEFAMKAIAGGRAVFVEKPITGTLETASQVIEAATKANVPLMVGQVVRYFPEFKRANGIVKNGGVGTPAAARTRRGGLAPKSPWFRDYERSGGVLLDLAIHDFDWLRWTLGEVKHLYARSVGLSKGTWPDYALTTLTFESGAIGHVEATWMDPAGSRVTFEVCGSDGMLEHDSRKTQVLKTTVLDENGNPKPTANEAPLAPADDPYFNELIDFVSALSNGTPPPVSGEDGFMALSIALAAIESARSGKVVTPSRP